jgi:2,3-diketo-5-methylthio-1-phosphopentane phosphatase
MSETGSPGGSLAVFCDFDGTFAVQDVGSTLVRRYAADLRPVLWKRFLAGELTAWEYNIEIFGSLRISEPEVDAFLESIDLDPGAADLVHWCEEHEVPFEVLSDGFDYNLDRLQEIHSLAFDYCANRVEIDPGGWRIERGFPDPDCFCGTGVCKRRCIEHFRAAHPGAFVAHIGNGLVSDTCGALVADLVFAKDSLAEELERRGVAYRAFSTLRDVVPVLAEVRRESRAAGRSAP